jgi:hypothetical protein
VATTAHAQSVDEMRENGTLLLLFVFGVFSVFYVFCLMMVFLASATEKRLNGKKKKPKNPTPPHKPDDRILRPAAPYSIPEAQSFLTNNKPKRNRAYA